MILSRELLVDLHHALDVLERDTSVVWKLTAADNLESLARRVREEVANSLKTTPPPPQAP